MKRIHNFIEKIVSSQYFKRTYILRYKAKNPDDRIFLENLYEKRKNIVSKEMDNEINTINKLKESYEFKVFEHGKMVEFYKKNPLASDFVKFCEFEQLQRKEMWTSKYFPFFIPPFITYKEYIWTRFRYLLLIATGVIFFKIGFHYGIKDSTMFDSIKEYVLDVRSEDQLFDILIKKGIPVLVLYYVPGQPEFIEMQTAQGAIAEKYGEKAVKMARVNCKYNLDLCLKKVQYITMPQWEIMYPPIQEEENGRQVNKFPVVPCKNSRDYEGLEGFLMNQNIIPDKFNPLYIMTSSMKKYEI